MESVFSTGIRHREIHGPVRGQKQQRIENTARGNDPVKRPDPLTPGKPQDVLVFRKHAYRTGEARLGLDSLGMCGSIYGLYPRFTRPRAHLTHAHSSRGSYRPRLPDSMRPSKRAR